MLRLFLILFFVIPVAEAASHSVTGSIEMDEITYFNEPDTDIDGRNELRSELKYQGQFTNVLSASGVAKARKDVKNEDRDDLYLKEGNLLYTVGDTDIMLGKNIYKWGQADEVNFTDNLNPVDYRDFLDTETLGVKSASMTSYFGDFRLQVVAIAEFVGSLLPTFDSPWRPILPGTVPNPLSPGSTLSANYQFLPSVEPANNLDNLQYAIKLSHTIGGLDYSVSFFDGWNTIPYFEERVLAMDATSITIGLEPHYEGWKVIGFDFATTFDRIGIRGEAAYFEPDFSEDPYVQYALGIDRTFADVFGNNNIYVIAQWMDEINDHETPVTSLGHLFQESILARARLEIGNSMSFALQGIYNHKAGDYLFQPEFVYNIVDDFSLTFSVDYLGGKETGFFGQYKDNKRYQLILKQSFEL